MNPGYIHWSRAAWVRGTINVVGPLTQAHWTSLECLGWLAEMIRIHQLMIVREIITSDLWLQPQGFFPSILCCGIGTYNVVGAQSHKMVGDQDELQCDTMSD